MFRPMRRNDKQMSHEESIALLIRGEEGILGTLGDHGYPYTVVLNYVYYNEKIYFHCATEGHKIDSINQYDKVSFTVYDHVKVIAEQLNTHYQSILVFGKAKVIPATKEILLALINKYIDMDPSKANKYIDNEIGVTSIIELEIEHLTGKIGK